MTSDGVLLLPLRLKKVELDKILAAMNAGAVEPSNNQRRSIRHPVRNLELHVTIASRGGPTTRHVVRARNLSSYGIGFLATAVMLPGTEIKITLPIGPSGTTIEKTAIVRRCTHVCGNTHEVGAAFGLTRCDNGPLPKPDNPAQSKPPDADTSTPAEPETP